MLMIFRTLLVWKTFSAVVFAANAQVWRVQLIELCALEDLNLNDNLNNIVFYSAHLIQIVQRLQHSSGAHASRSRVCGLESCQVLGFFCFFREINCLTAHLLLHLRYFFSLVCFQTLHLHLRLTIDDKATASFLKCLLGEDSSCNPSCLAIFLSYYITPGRIKTFRCRGNQTHLSNHHKPSFTPWPLGHLRGAT